MASLTMKMNEYEKDGLEDYNSSKKKMDSYIDKMERTHSPKIERRLKQVAKDYGGQVPDKLEKLKDENLNLKSH